jgi:hypothetical protein
LPRFWSAESKQFPSTVKLQVKVQVKKLKESESEREMKKLEFKGVDKVKSESESDSQSEHRKRPQVKRECTIGVKYPQNIKRCPRKQVGWTCRKFHAQEQLFSVSFQFLA